MKILAVVLVIVAIAVPGFTWEVTSSEDLMAGTQVWFLSSRSEVSQGTLREPAIVIRRGSDGTPELFINWGGYRLDGDTHPIIVRMGEANPEGWMVSLSTSGEATFIRQADEFIDALNELEPGQKVVAKSWRASGAAMTARWDTTGFREAYERFLAAGAE